MLNDLRACTRDRASRCESLASAKLLAGFAAHVPSAVIVCQREIDSRPALRQRKCAKCAFEKDELHCRDELEDWEHVVRITGKGAGALGGLVFAGQVTPKGAEDEQHKFYQNAMDQPESKAFVTCRPGDA